MVQADKEVLRRYAKTTGHSMLIVEGLPFDVGNVFCVINHKLQDASQNRAANEFSVVDITNKATISSAVDDKVFQNFIDTSKKDVLTFKDHPDVKYCLFDFTEY